MMPLQNLQQITEANFEVTQALDDFRTTVSGAEQWHKNYKKDKAAFNHLIKLELKFERELKRYFKEQEARILPYIQWWKYTGDLMKAAEYTEDINWDDEIVRLAVVFNTLDEVFDMGISEAALQTGVTSALTVEDASHQRYLKQYGLSKAKNINQTTKDRIQAKLNKAVAQNMSTTQAAQLLVDSGTINDPKRASLIAQTEIVEARSGGIYQTGKRLGAKGKIWLAVPDACAICAPNAAQGEIRFDKEFFSGHLKPTAHPRCRCDLELVL